MRRILALTYEPKIEGVINGSIRQTIRPITDHLRPWRIGDSIAFHGWSGAPYDSEWSFRTQYNPVTFAEPIRGSAKGLIWRDVLWEWDCQVVEALAISDGIVPATGPELKRVLESYHSDIEGRSFQVIRW